MALPVLLTPAAIAAAKAAGAKLARSGAARKMAGKAYLNTPAKSNVLLDGLGVGVGASTTKGSKMFTYIALAVGLVIVLFVAALGMGFINLGQKDDRKQRSEVPPSPMNNARVSRPAHEERMFTNKPDRRNKYRKQLSTGDDLFESYGGTHPRGFSQSEESYLHPMNNNSNVKKPQFYLKNPGNNNPSILSEINLSDDPAYEEELYDEMKSNLMDKDNRRKARLSKSIKNGKYNTGHIDQVSEINVASSLSASNNFQGPFGTNNGDRVVQRYIQPIEKRGVTSDALNFASITK